MSLKVWLPLNGDLRNLGASGVAILLTSTQGNIVDGGKLGKGFKTGTSGNINLGYNPNINTGSVSFGGWFKFNKAEIAAVVEAQTYEGNYSTSTGNLLGNDSYGGIGIIWETNNMITTPTFTTLNIFGALRTSSTNQNTRGFSAEFDTWIHICLTFDRITGKLSLYKNGQLVDTKIFGAFSDATTNVIMMNKIAVYGGNARTPSLPFITNDIRIYDHCLSALEVKELSYGLVCHYKFDNMYNTNNLILNGNGELGSKHWSSSTNISTTEIPPNQPIIKGSFYSNNTTDFIAINKYNTYTLNSYIKATSTSGTFYPSIFPYDVDKKQIMTYNCSEGFSNTYKTTLAQPLKKGDTVIYATDLSAWTTSNNYYYHVAIFGYKDSKGFIYPDMQYTADSPTFGTKTDKSKIDKTNNTITLNAAFTGEDRPVGTTICQATEGSTYYYPFGGLASTSVQDWTLKTANIVPKNVPKLVWAKYIRWNAYSGGYYAGNKLMDMTWWDNHIKDDSGNGYNLEVVNNLLADSDTPRYSYSTRFPLNTSYCRVTFPSVTGFADSYTFSWWGKYTNYSSHMMWGFQNGNRLNLYMSSGNYYWNTGDGNNNPFNVSAATYGDNKWHYFAVTGDGTTAKLYIDGVFKANAKTYKGITGTNLYFNGWDTATNYKFCGCLSDFKLFATVLSADDIKRIYEEAVSIGKLGDMHPYEVKEDTTNGINKDGVFSNQVFAENYLTEASKYDNNLYIEPDGAVFVRICHHNNPGSYIFASSDDFLNGVNKNSGNTWCNFAIMNDCTSWEFMVKQKFTTTVAEQIYRWTQPVNPLTATFADVAAANVTFNSDSRYTIGTYKGGIYKFGTNTYLSQNNGNSSNWFGALGAWARWQNGVPSVGMSTPSITTGYMDLYIRIDNQLKLGNGVFKKYKHNNTWYSPCIIER